MRVREFLMKDAYSFHRDFEDLGVYYKDIYNGYLRIFKRIGLSPVPSRPIPAPWGQRLHEFLQPSQSGRTRLPAALPAAWRPTWSGPRSSAPWPPPQRAAPAQDVHTPDITTIDGLTTFSVSAGIAFSRRWRIRPTVRSLSPHQRGLRDQRDQAEELARRAGAYRGRRIRARGRRHSPGFHLAAGRKAPGRNRRFRPNGHVPAGLRHGGIGSTITSRTRSRARFQRARDGGYRHRSAGDACPRCGRGRSSSCGHRAGPHVSARHEILRIDGARLPFGGG